MPIRQPFVMRPRLGSRFFVRGHIRKYWGAIFKEIKDINLENRIRAANLSLMGIIYTENHMTTHMDKFTILNIYNTIAISFDTLVNI